MKRTKILMNELIYLGLSVLEISNIVMHEFWYDYMILKYRKINKIMLHGYRWLYSLHENRRHLCRYCKTS